MATKIKRRIIRIDDSWDGTPHIYLEGHVVAEDGTILRSKVDDVTDRIPPGQLVVIKKALAELWTEAEPRWKAGK